MARANKKHFGGGAQGKGDGTGGLSGDANIPENMVLSNRDKTVLSHNRGQDGKWVQAEQQHDTEMNQKKS